MPIKKTSIKTDAYGVPHIDATDARDMFRQLGVIHATERSVQMILMRILGQGRGSELLDSSDIMLGIDTFFRRMNWTTGLAAEILKLSAAEQAQLVAYCDGINSVLTEKNAMGIQTRRLPFRTMAARAFDSDRAHDGLPHTLAVAG
jgi:penicillin amidase